MGGSEKAKEEYPELINEVARLKAEYVVKLRAYYAAMEARDEQIVEDAAACSDGVALDARRRD